MICPTCNNNVHPQPFRMSVGCCVKCGVEIPGFKAYDDRYTCPSCGHLDRAVPQNKFIPRCPVESCGARMSATEEVVDVAPAVLLPGEAQSLLERAPPVRLATRPVAKTTQRDEPVDPVAQCRERLAFVTDRIAELRAYEREERRLNLMLAVIDADDLAAE